ncbi:hypothetical protein GCM10028774_61360 [Spirosoma jeollabukense]
MDSFGTFWGNTEKIGGRDVLTGTSVVAGKGTVESREKKERRRRINVIIEFREWIRQPKQTFRVKTAVNT